MNQYLNVFFLTSDVYEVRLARINSHNVYDIISSLATVLKLLNVYLIITVMTRDKQLFFLVNGETILTTIKKKYNVFMRTAERSENLKL